MNRVEVIGAKIAKNSIRERLAQAGISQEEAARCVGCSYRHFNRVVLGLADPTLLVASRMATVLETKVEDLFTVKVRTRARAEDNGNK